MCSKMLQSIFAFLMPNATTHQIDVATRLQFSHFIFIFEITHRLGIFNCHMKKYFSLLLLVLAPSAIAENYELTDTRAKAIVVADVLTAKCWRFYPSDTYVRYRKAASRLLSVAKVNSEKYNERYQKLNEVTDSLSEDRMKADCYEFIPKVSAMIPEMDIDYRAYLDLIDAEQRRQANSWSEALELFSNFANSIGQAAVSQNFLNIPIPSSTVNFGAPQRGRYNHYLVNTPRGTQQCHVAGSGYIFCN